MKRNILALTAIVLAATCTPSAYAVDAFVNYQYVKADTGTHSTSHEVRTGFRLPLWLLSVDAAAIGHRDNSISKDDTVGYEVGAGLKFKVMKLGLYGRAAYGQRFKAETAFGSKKGYYSLQLGSNFPVTNNLALTAGLKHTNGLNNATADATNQVGLGLSYQLSKAFNFTAEAQTLRAEGRRFNGLETSVNYSF